MLQFRPLALRTLALPLIAALAAAPALAGEGARPAWFKYDHGFPFHAETEKLIPRDDANVSLISFAGWSAKERVQAYLVGPQRPGPYPAVLFVHWFGDPATTGKQQFLDEAVRLARYGVISILVDAMWSKPGWFNKQRPEDDYQASVKQVVVLRRALDVLLSQPDVDRSRVAFVGHDFGAMYGVLAGVADGRPKTYVLMAPAPTFTEWYLLRKRQPKDKAAYLKQMGEMDVVKWLGQLAPASVLLQFSDNDQYVPRERAQLLIDAAKAPKESRFYAVGHEMDAKDAAEERFRWLARELGLKVDTTTVDGGTPGAPKPDAGR